MEYCAKSLSVQQEEAIRVNHSVTLETVAVILFLLGSLLVLAAFVNTTGYWVELIAPEQAQPPEGWMKNFPGMKLGLREVFLGFMPFLLPATFLMSTGIVLRRFLSAQS